MAIRSFKKLNALDKKCYCNVEPEIGYTIYMTANSQQTNKVGGDITL